MSKSDKSGTSSQPAQTPSAPQLQQAILEKRGNLTTQPAGVQIPPTAQFTPVTPQQPATQAPSGGASGGTAASGGGGTTQAGSGGAE